MPEEEKKIFVDDDWKQEARQEKERLAQQEAQAKPEQLPEASFADLLNLVAIQAMVGLGLVSGPGGERMPPNLPVAKHFIDVMEVLEQKTRNNLTPEEQQLLQKVIHDMRMGFVELAKAVGTAAPPPSPTGSPDVENPSA